MSTESEHDIELTTNDEKYTIKLSEIYIGRFNVENNVTTTTFSIISWSTGTGSSYQCIEGCTWEEWLNSDYNIDNLRPGVWYWPSGRPVDGVTTSDGIGVTNESYDEIVITDVIDSQKSYLLVDLY